jgi:hypothetical protein
VISDPSPLGQRNASNEERVFNHRWTQIFTDGR